MTDKKKSLSDQLAEDKKLFEATTAIDEGIVSGQLPEISPDQSLYNLAHYFPISTGLPMTIWLGTKEDIQSAQIFVAMENGQKTKPAKLAIIQVSQPPKIIAGSLSEMKFNLLTKWIELNLQNILKYWKDDISTGEFSRNIKKI